jgi:hypothetical protein
MREKHQDDQKREDRLDPLHPAFGWMAKLSLHEALPAGVQGNR